jgi:formylglycine-generating enzyme required for sulfatase activity
VIKGPVEFMMGSPPTEPDRESGEIPHRVVIPRRFAIADREVTVEQYQRFVMAKPQFGPVPRGFDLQLMFSVKDMTGIPTAETSLIIVAIVDHVLHFRIFDGDGNVVVDTDEKKRNEQSRQIEDLRNQIENLRPRHELTVTEKVRIIVTVTSIVDHTRARPMLDLSWHEAAAYCNWLSEQEGLPPDQWCYLPANGENRPEMTIPADVLRRTGYRLPTEAEWEYACRSGTVTSRYHGFSPNLLVGYARYQGNSNNHAWECGSLRPNDLGLFDMLGNAYEWLQDEHQTYKAGQAQAASDDINITSMVNPTTRLLRGGSYANHPPSVRSAFRISRTPSSRNYNFGFRPSRTCP